MDPITHALSGALLARAIAARTSRGAAPTAALPIAAAATTAAPSGRWSAPWDGRAGAPALWQCVVAGTLAAVAPDIDFVVQWFGDIAYLRHHRGLTHSALMLPIWALLLAWLLSKSFAVTRAQRGGWRSFYVLAAGGLALHLAGDWITQFGTMLLQPLSNHRFGLGAVFIIDLVLSGTLVAGLALAAFFPRRRWPAALGLAAAVAWVVFAWTGQQAAREVGLAHAKAVGIAAPVVEVMPRPASPFNWTISVADGDRYEVAHINTRRNAPVHAGPDANFVRRFTAPYLPVNEAPWHTQTRYGGNDAPAWIRSAWQAEGFGFFRWFALAPVLARHDETVGADGVRERCAWFSDLRFDFPGREVAPFTYGVCLKGEGNAAAARVYKLEDGAREPL